MEDSLCLPLSPAGGILWNTFEDEHTAEALLVMPSHDQFHPIIDDITIVLEQPSLYCPVVAYNLEILNVNELEYLTQEILTLNCLTMGKPKTMLTNCH